MSVLLMFCFIGRDMGFYHSEGGSEGWNNDRGIWKACGLVSVLLMFICIGGRSMRWFHVHGN